MTFTFTFPSTSSKNILKANTCVFFFRERFFFFFLFICWLPWVFVAAHGPSLVVASGDSSLGAALRLH